MTLRHRHRLEELHRDFVGRINAATIAFNMDLAERLTVEKFDEAHTLRGVQLAELRDLREAQRTIMLETGVDPDAAAVARREAQRVVMRQHMMARARRLGELRQADILADADRRAAQAVRAAPIVQRELAAFVADPQNVHTTESVRQTKEVVARVLRIPVPEDYRWHRINASKTPFEVGLECKLTQNAAWQMMSQYAQAVAIYDIEPGIYGKVLDAVWQYVKGSSEKEELCKIVRQELQDNVGMCAQGNLSRLCNILSGYLDGVAPPESVADRLGRLLPPLVAVDDPYARFLQAVGILKENRVVRDSWAEWLEALKVDDDDQEALDDVLLSA